MRNIKYWFLALITIIVMIIIFIPLRIEKKLNATLLEKPYQVSDDAKKLFNQLDFVADLHSDALLWNRDLTKKHKYGHVDFPRMQSSNMAFQTFALTTKAPTGQNFHENSSKALDKITLLSIAQLQPFNTWFSLVNRGLYQCKKLQDFSQEYRNDFHVVKTKKEFEIFLDERSKNKNVIGGLLAIEGAHCLEGKMENFELLYDAGVRMLGPAHFFDNEMGGSAHGEVKMGLTDFGFDLLQRMHEKNVIMDLAHSSEKVIEDVLNNYEGPIVSSHTGVQAVYNTPRNLSDDQIKRIASKNGLVGLAYFEGAMGEVSIEKIVESIKYVKDLVGVEYVALGSDFDGAVATPFDCTGLVLLVDEMLKNDFTADEIRAVMGENVKQFLLKNLL